MACVKCHESILPHGFTPIEALERRPLPGRPAPARSAFTLIELLVVIAIMAVLASVVTLSLFNRPGEARMAAAKMQIRIFQTALQNYRVDQGAPPTTEQGLQALVEQPVLEPVPRAYPAEGYLDTRRIPDDPWGNDYIYLAPGREGQAYEILTYGSDGEPGGDGEAADISSSEL
jgi:general secretion pathway protein G